MRIQILLLLATLLASVDSIFYNIESYCQLVNSTDGVQPISIKCPDEAAPVGFRVPAYCCGTVDDKFCCEFSTFVINSVGFGRTSIGLLLFVCAFFVASLVLVITVCGLFRVCCVLRWEQDVQAHNNTIRARQRAGSSRCSSYRPNRRGGSVDTTYSIPVPTGDQANVV